MSQTIDDILSSLPSTGGSRSPASSWSPDQLDTARKIYQIGRERNEPDDHIRAALSTGIVESGFKNLTGDKNLGSGNEAYGVFQQRPVSGWGSKQQVQNVDYAARKFYDAAGKVQKYRSPGHLAAQVQRPRADLRGRYDQELPKADQLFEQFQGDDKPGPTIDDVLQKGIGDGGIGNIRPGRAGDVDNAPMARSVAAPPPQPEAPVNEFSNTPISTLGVGRGTTTVNGFNTVRPRTVTPEFSERDFRKYLVDQQIPRTQENLQKLRPAFQAMQIGDPEATDKFLAIPPQRTPTLSKALIPSGQPVTNGDLLWHARMDATTFAQLPKLKQQAVLRGVAAEAKADEVRKSKGEQIAQPTLEQQNAFRAKYGLEPVTPNQQGFRDSLQFPGQFDANTDQLVGRVKGQSRALANRVVSGVLNPLPQADRDTATKAAIRQQILEERAQTERSMATRPQRGATYSQARLPDLTEEDLQAEIERRFGEQPTEAERAQAGQRIAGLEGQNYFERQWKQPYIESFVHKAQSVLGRAAANAPIGSGALTEYLKQGFTSAADQARSQAKIDDLVSNHDYEGDHGVMRQIGREGVKQAFSLVPMIVSSEATGIPFPYLMAGQSYIENESKPLNERLFAAGTAYLLGKAYETLPNVGVKGLQAVPGRIGKLATKYPGIASRVVGAAGFGGYGAGETALRGGTAEQALVSGISQAIPGAALAGEPEGPEAAREPLVEGERTGLVTPFGRKAPQDSPLRQQVNAIADSLAEPQSQRPIEVRKGNAAQTLTSNEAANQATPVVPRETPQVAPKGKANNQELSAEQPNAGPTNPLDSFLASKPAGMREALEWGADAAIQDGHLSVFVDPEGATAADRAKIDAYTEVLRQRGYIVTGEQANLRSHTVQLLIAKAEPPQVGEVSNKELSPTGDKIDKVQNVSNERQESVTRPSPDRRQADTGSPNGVDRRVGDRRTRQVQNLREERRSLKEQRDTAQRAAETDYMTQLGNRAALDKALPAAEADPNISVVSFDANEAGKVNKMQEHGPVVGDSVINRMANAIKQAAAEFGVAPRIFRRGGDEFVGLFPKDKAEQIRNRAEEIAGVETYQGIHGQTGEALTANTSLTGSIGDTFETADAGLQGRKASQKAQQRARDEAGRFAEETPEPRTIDDILTKEQSNATSTREDKGNTPEELPGAGSGEDVSAHNAEVREGQGRSPEGSDSAERIGAEQEPVQESKAGQVGASQFERVKSVFAGKDVEPQRIAFADRTVDGFIVDLGNGKKVAVIPREDEIRFDIQKVSKDWKVTPDRVARALGKYRGDIAEGGLIEIAHDADVGVLTHEKFHALFDLVYTPQEQARLINRYGSEEKAAEAYRRDAGHTTGTFDKVRALASKLRTLAGGEQFPEETALSDTGKAPTIDSELKKQIVPDRAITRQGSKFVAPDGTEFTGKGARRRAEEYAKQKSYEGATVKSYGGGLDKVLSVTPNSSGLFDYKVEAEDGSTRTHSTQLTDKDVAAWPDGEREKLPTVREKPIENKTTLGGGLADFYPGVQEFVSEDIAPHGRSAMKFARAATGIFRTISSALKLNTAQPVIKNLGDDAYAGVIRAIHTGERKLEEFGAQRSKVFDANMNELRRQFDRLPGSEMADFNLMRGTPETPEGKKLQADAIDRLKKSPNFASFDKLQKAVKDSSDSIWQYATDNGLDMNYFEDYFYGNYKNSEKVQKFLDYWKSTDRYLKDKTFPTIADAAGFGLELKNPNPITNLESEMSAVGRRVGLLKLREDLVAKKVPYAVETESLTDAEKKLLASSGWDVIHDPVFKGMKFEPDYARFANALLETSKIGRNPLLKVLQQTNRTLRQIKFFGSVFHMVNMLKASVADEAGSVADPRGYQKFGESFKAVDRTDPQYLDYVNLGGGHGYSAEADASGQLQRGLERLGRGNILGGVPRILSGIAQSPLIPGGPGFSHWMFSDYIPTLKYAKYEADVTKGEAKLGRPLTDGEKIQIIKRNQNFYGEMNERLFGRSATATQALRIIFTAPGYGEGNFRTGGRAITGDLKSARFVASSLLTTVVASTLATRILTGHWPAVPRSRKDLRDLMKIQTGMEDAAGRPLTIDAATYDKDFYLQAGLLTGGYGTDTSPGEDLRRRVSGGESPAMQMLADTSQWIRTGKVLDWKGKEIINPNQTWGQKAKAVATEAKDIVQPIPFSTYNDARDKGFGVAASVAQGITGIRPASKYDPDAKGLLFQGIKQAGGAKVVTEMHRLGIERLDTTRRAKMGENDKKQTPLTDAQQKALANATNQYLNPTLDKLMSSPAYSKMTDEQKKDAIQEVIRDIKSNALEGFKGMTFKEKRALSQGAQQ